MTAASKPTAMSSQLTRHRFTIEEYEAMIEHGVLDDDSRVELLAGEIIERMGEGPRHLACKGKLNRLLIMALGKRANLLPNGPIALPPDSMPEPDITLAVERDDFYAGRRPLASDVLLLIEVSDSSLRKDRDLKLTLYAQAGVAEYWIVNLVDNVVEVYTKPEGDVYRGSCIARISDSVSPTAFSDTQLRVRDIIP